MANWYYYAKSGQKQGTITTAELKMLAMQGVLSLDSIVENGNGRSSAAGEINGLIFPEQVSVNWYYYDAKEQKIGPMSRKSLQLLAEQGVIISETIIEKEEVRTTAAEVLKGIKFAEPAPPPESLNWFYYDAKGQKTGPMSFTVMNHLQRRALSHERPLSNRKADKLSSPEVLKG
jgi:glucan-binding YG repeat protein